MWAVSNIGDRTVFNDTSGQVFESLTLPPGNYVISGEATFTDEDRDFAAGLQLVVNWGAHRRRHGNRRANGIELLLQL